MEVELEQLNQENEAAAQKLVLRVRQFQYLLYALEDLRKTLNQEREAEAALKDAMEVEGIEAS